MVTQIQNTKPQSKLILIKGIYKKCLNSLDFFYISAIIL